MLIDRNKIEYRKIKKDEISILVEYRIRFLLELQGEQPAGKEDTLKKGLYKYFQTSLTDNTYSSWIAEYDNKIIGIGGMVIQTIPGNFNLLNGTEGYILNMYTLPEYRKNRICSEIFDRLVNEGKELGLNKIYLHASNDGIRLYRRKGFAEPVMPELEFVILQSDSSKS
jgi:ribosomal protein S18 acetylase RimI-like enzyme